MRSSEGANMRIIGGLFISAALATSALAEPLAYQNGLSRVDGVVGLGLTIPLGGTRQKAPPRVELRLTRDMVSIDGTRLSNHGIPLNETRIGVSLERDNRLLLNGRPIETARRNNVSTVGWIAIGAGVVLIGGAVLLADAARDASE
ncbi:hypothetical protein [Sphingopyxis sp. L1A2A]|uniref:hypothetical protein n=1 Tax=Sphingopyxis sp. L1A2A TaxID=2502247 RepID=UPI0010F9B341|nr:hypothetical protein [Sphingopyxis sp. L1A2A]